MDSEPNDEQTAIDSSWAVIARVASRLYAVPAKHVVETMRLLPIESIAAAPPFVRGLAIIRGAPVPVIDLALLLGEPSTPVTRLLLIRVGARHAAIAVEDILGVRKLDLVALAPPPPLLQAARGDLIESMGAVDAQLLLVLRTARLLPEDLWNRLERPQQ